MGGSDNRGLGRREPLPLPRGNDEDGDGKNDEKGEDGEADYVGVSDKLLLVQKLLQVLDLIYSLQPPQEVGASSGPRATDEKIEARRGSVTCPD